MIKNIQNLTLEAAVKSKKAENTPNEAKAKNPIYFYSNWYLLPGFWKRHEHVSLSFYWLKTKFIFPPPAPKQSPDEVTFSLLRKTFLGSRKFMHEKEKHERKRAGFVRWLRDSSCRNSESLKWKRYRRRLKASRLVSRAVEFESLAVTFGNVRGINLKLCGSWNWIKSWKYGKSLHLSDSSFRSFTNFLSESRSFVRLGIREKKKIEEIFL